MKTLSMLFLLLLTLNVLPAQNHFVFIQSEMKQPFSVVANGKSYNSTGTGYVIIPKLPSGDHELRVKPKDGSEGKFYININKKDVGFNLKAGNELALTDIQSFVTLKAGEKQMLASAGKENILSKLRKGINKIFERQEPRAIAVRYVDVHDASADTIDILIPLASATAPGTESTEDATAVNKNATSSNLSKGETGLSLLAVKQEGYNVRCVNLASGEDFNRLRRKMSAETTVDKMINEAKKAAKNKCYTTVQIKNLSTLFNSDNGRLKFFQAVYPLVYDYLQYPVLEKEFTDSAYADRFRGILKSK
jgi:hypothetical protein